jgi:hypothetical protein
MTTNKRKSTASKQPEKVSRQLNCFVVTGFEA